MSDCKVSIYIDPSEIAMSPKGENFLEGKGDDLSIEMKEDIGYSFDNEITVQQDGVPTTWHEVPTTSHEVPTTSHEAPTVPTTSHEAPTVPTTSHEVNNPGPSNGEPVPSSSSHESNNPGTSRNEPVPSSSSHESNNPGTSRNEPVPSTSFYVGDDSSASSDSKEGSIVEELSDDSYDGYTYAQLLAMRRSLAKHRRTQGNSSWLLGSRNSDPGVHTGTSEDDPIDEGLFADFDQVFDGDFFRIPMPSCYAQDNYNNALLVGTALITTTIIIILLYCSFYYQKSYK